MATEKKKFRVPREVREWLERRGLVVVQVPDAATGGVARWEGVPPEERSRLNTIASKKAAEARTAKAKARREAAAKRKAVRLLKRLRKSR